MNEVMFAPIVNNVAPIHRNLIVAVETALKKIFHEKKYADAVIESLLRENPKWGSRDRKFIAETTYDIVRWWRKILFCGNLVDHDEFVFRKAIQTFFILQKLSIPPWLNEGLDPALIEQRELQAEKVRAIRESVPDWLDQLGENELGEKWDDELKALNEQASVVLRVNTLKISREGLQRELLDSKIETEILSGRPDALVLKKRTNVFQLAAFKEGKFEVQDASSQEVAPFLHVHEKMRVIDACAGGGGKTLHLAALMKNSGHIIAMDVEQRKLDELKRRARRNGATNIETRLIDSTKATKRLHQSADRVLLDVPCSGLGVLRRNPDAKWKLSLEYIDRVKNIQKEILEKYSLMVKPGGNLVYATCSILHSENQLQVQNFLRGAAPFHLEEEKQILPSEGFDGFYMARMTRKD